MGAIPPALKRNGMLVVARLYVEHWEYIKAGFRGQVQLPSSYGVGCSIGRVVGEESLANRKLAADMSSKQGAMYEGLV